MEEIFNELLGQISGLLQAQTDGMKQIFDEYHQTTESIQVSVAGSTMTVLTHVLKDSKTSTQIKAVAESFSVLNNSLMVLEQNLSKLNEISVGGKRLTNLTKMLEDLAELGDKSLVDNLKRLGKLEKTEAENIVSFFNIFADLKIDDLEFESKSLESVLDLLEGFDKEFKDNVKRAATLKTDDAQNIVDFLNKFTDLKIDSINLDINRFRTLQTFFSGFDKEFKDNVKRAATLKTDDAQNIVAFLNAFVGLSIDKLNLDVDKITCLAKFLGGIDADFKRHFVLAASLKAEDAQKIVEFLNAFDNLKISSNINTKSVGDIITLLKTVGDKEVKDSLKNISKIDFDSVKPFVEFLKDLGEHLERLEKVKPPTDKVKSLVKTIQIIGKDDLVENIKKAKRLKKRDVKRIFEFFQVFADEAAKVKSVEGKDFKFFESIAKFMQTVINPDFIKNLKTANRVYKKIPIINKFLLNPKNIPQWFKKFIDELSDISTSGLDDKTKVITKVVTFIDSVTNSKFLKRLTMGTMYYSKTNTSKKHPIVKFFDNFIKGLNKIKVEDHVKTVIKTIKEIREFIEMVTKLKFMTKLMIAGKMYATKTVQDAAVKIPQFFGKFLNNLEKQIGKKEKSIKELEKSIRSFKHLVDNLLSVAGKVLVLALISPLMVAAGAGFMLYIGVLKVILKGVGWLGKSITKEYPSYIKTLTLLTVLLGKLLLVAGGVMVLALASKLINYGDILKLFVIFGMVFALLGILKVMTLIFVDPLFLPGMIALNICLVLLATTVLLLGIAAVIASEITSGGMVALFGIILASMLLLGLLSLIVVSGLGEIGFLGAVMLGAAMVILSVALTITVGLLVLCSKAQKHMPAIRKVMLGLIMVLSDLASHAMDIIIGGGAAIFFSVGVIALSFGVMFAVIAAKLASFWKPEDKKNLRNVVRGMISIFDLVDDYFGKKTIGNKIPIWGALARAIDAIGGFVTLTMFSFAVALLTIAITLTIIVAKLASTVKPSDIRSMKNVIKGMISIFDMITEFFKEETISWGLVNVPILGDLFKIWTAVGVGLQIIAFSIMMILLGTATSIMVGVMNLASTVSTRDVKAFKDVLSGVLDIFKDITNWFSEMSGLTGKIPIIGDVYKLVNATGALVGVVAFSVTMSMLGAAALKIVQTIEAAKKISDTDIAFFREKVIRAMLDIINMIYDELGFFSGWKTDTVEDFADMMKPIIKVVDLFVDLVKKYNKVNKELGGRSIGDVGSQITSDLKLFLTGLGEIVSFSTYFTTMFMSWMAEDLKPVFDTLSKFIDMVGKLATMTIVVGYDENEKPIYKKVKPSAFKDASEAITTGFTQFMSGLSKGFSDVSVMGLLAMSYLSDSMFPIMQSVDAFTDAIIKLCTAQVADGWDENGHPNHYKQLNFSEHGDAYKAAKVLTDMFGTFLTNLATMANSLGFMSMFALDSLKDCIYPIMQAVDSFTDSIIKLSTCQVATEWDENGRATKYVEIGQDKMENSAKMLCEQFSTFINKLITELKPLKDWSTRRAIESLGETIEPIMSAASDFTDAIIKLSTGTILTGYDANGKPTYEKVESTEYAKGAKVLVDNFANFVNEMITKSVLLSNESIEAAAKIFEVMETIMDPVSQFVDCIIKMGSGQYIDSYDDDGKPHYERLLPEDYITYATNIATAFNTFVSKLSTGFKDIVKGDDFKALMTLLGAGEDGETLFGGDVQTTGETMGMIFECIGNFAKTMELFAGEKMYVVEGWDENGKPIYAKDQNGRVFQIDFKVTAQKIAESFSTFVATLASKLNDETLKSNVASCSEMIESLSSFMSPVKDFATILGNVNELFSKDGMSAVDVAQDIAKAVFMFISTLDKSVRWSDGTYGIKWEGDHSNIKYFGELMNEYSGFWKDGLPKMTKSFGEFVSNFKEVNIDSAFLDNAKLAGQSMLAFLQGIDGDETGQSNLAYYSTTLTEYANDFASGLKTLLTPIKEFCVLYQDITIGEDLVTKMGNAGRAISSFLYNIDHNSTGGVTSILNTYGTEDYLEKMENFQTVTSTAIGIAQEFQNFGTFDFSHVNENVEMFNTALTNLMLIDIDRCSLKFAKGCTEIMTKLSQLGSSLDTAKAKLNSFKEAAVDTIDTIDKKLAENESRRNQQLQDLADNFEKVSTKVGQLKSALDSLKNNGMESFLNNLASAIQQLNTLAANVQANQDNPEQVSVSPSSGSGTNVLNFGGSNDKVEMHFKFSNMQTGEGVVVLSQR